MCSDSHIVAEDRTGLTDEHPVGLGNADVELSARAEVLDTLLQTADGGESVIATNWDVRAPQAGDVDAFCSELYRPSR